MDGYAPAYVAHNVPLLIVSGLGLTAQNPPELEGDGFRITSEVPPVQTEDAQVLLQYFLKGSANGLAWNSREHTGRNKFKIKTVGRVWAQDTSHLSHWLKSVIGLYSTTTRC
jgi:hypothetical protein